MQRGWNQGWQDEKGQHLRDLRWGMRGFELARNLITDLWSCSLHVSLRAGCPHLSQSDPQAQLSHFQIL